jgi:hypothetical protein
MKTTSRKCTSNCGRFPTRLNLGFPIQHMSVARSCGFTRRLLFGCLLPEDCRDSEEGEANSGVQVMRSCDLRRTGEEKSDGRRWVMGLAGRESGSVWVPSAKGEAVRSFVTTSWVQTSRATKATSAKSIASIPTSSEQVSISARAESRGRPESTRSEAGETEQR